MQALVLNKPGDVSLTEIPTPVPDANQVLIKIRASGICKNDVRDYLGKCAYTYPRVGGHEFAGTIAALGSAVDTTRFQIGQRVAKYIIEDCKQCYFCRRGHENICEENLRSRQFYAPDGISGFFGFAEYAVADTNDVVVYEREESFLKMAFTEPVACVINSIERTDIHFGQDCLVIGAGTMGLLHVMLLQQRGARVIVSEPMEARRAQALRLGAAEVIDPKSGDAVQMVRNLTEGRGADYVFCAAAHPSVVAQAIDMTAACGTCVLFSSIHPREDVPIDAGRIHSSEITITGAVSPTIQSFFEAGTMLDKGLIDPTPLIEGVFNYTNYHAAIDAALRPDSYKVIVAFGE